MRPHSPKRHARLRQPQRAPAQAPLAVLMLRSVRCEWIGERGGNRGWGRHGRPIHPGSGLQGVSLLTCFLREDTSSHVLVAITSTSSEGASSMPVRRHRHIAVRPLFPSTPEAALVSVRSRAAKLLHEPRIHFRDIGWCCHAVLIGMRYWPGLHIETKFLYGISPPNPRSATR